MSKEYKNYSSFLESIEDPNIKRRVELSLKYYINKAFIYKNMWIGFSLATIAFPAAATCLAGIDVPNCAIPISTALATVASGFLAFFKCADKKTSYRNSAET